MLISKRYHRERRCVSNHRPGIFLHHRPLNHEEILGLRHGAHVIPTILQRTLTHSIHHLARATRPEPPPLPDPEKVPDLGRDAPIVQAPDRVRDADASPLLLEVKNRYLYINANKGTR